MPELETVNGGCRINRKPGKASPEGGDDSVGGKPQGIDYLAATGGLKKLILLIYLVGLFFIVAVEILYYLNWDKGWHLVVADLVIYNSIAAGVAYFGYRFAARTWLSAYVTESTLLSVTEISSDAVYVIGKDFVIRSWSKGAERIFGYTGDESLGQSMSIILPDGALRSEREVFAELEEKDVLTGRRTYFRRKNGDVFPAGVSGTLLKDPEGEPTDVVVVVRDISEQVEMEEALRSARDQLETRVSERTRELEEANLIISREVAERKRVGNALEKAHRELREEKEFMENAINTMEDIFVVFDLEGRFLTWNRSAGRITGYSDREIRAMGVADFFTPDELSIVNEGISTGLEKGFARVEACLHTKDGRLLPYEFFGTPLKGQEEDDVGVMVIGRDVTERRRLIEIEKSTAAVMAAAEVAKEDAKELKDLIELAAHELRHPATLFKSYSYILLEQKEKLDGEMARLALKNINIGADRLVHIVNELFETMLIERNKLKFVTEEVRPVDLVQRAVEEMVARGAGSRFETSRCQEGETISVDPEKVKDALVILLDNAAKYSPPDVDILAWCSYADGEAVFSVEDRGPGIPRESREKIFERFQQVEDVMHHSLPGLGLGLYLARRIIEAHGGRVSVEEPEAGGSLFRFRIPLKTGGGFSGG